MDLKPNMANLISTEGHFLFGRKNNPNSQPKFPFVNSELFLPNKKMSFGGGGGGIKKNTDYHLKIGR